jgi:hypothetical protein
MLHALHLAALSLVVCLSAVCLGISVHALNHSLGGHDLPSDSFDHFAVAASVLTLLATIPLYVVWRRVTSPELTGSHAASS